LIGIRFDTPTRAVQHDREKAELFIDAGLFIA